MTLPGHVQRRHVEAWLADLAARGRSDSTRSVRLKALSRWFDWLADEPGSAVKTNPCAKVQRPNPKVQPVPIVADESIRRLLASLKGSSFLDLRDTAITRFLADTGCRRAEVAGLTTDDVDLEPRTWMPVA